MIADEHLEDKTSYATIWLGYFKQGDDLCGYIENSDSLVDALRADADGLRGVVEQLESVADEVQKYDLSQVSIDAGTHHIGISGPEPLIQSLIDKKLAQRDEWEDEECDEEDFEDEEV